MQPFSMPHLWKIPRNKSLASWRAWNATIDAVFYDVTALSRQKREILSAIVNPEGSI
ncbi:MAG: hypothetical protein ACOZF0_16700 [Thermodesulfobacteriota bacterium]